MTPRQRELLWAYSIIFGVVAFIVWLNNMDNVWGVMAALSLGALLVYVGARDLGKKNFIRSRQETRERRARHGLERFNDNVDDETAYERYKYTVPRFFIMGIFLISFALISIFRL